MRLGSRRLAALTAAVAAAAAAGTAACAAGAAEWRFAPAQAPPAPPAAAEAPYGVPVGPVGDLKFWAPNRGLLIAKGNNLVPMGLYAYDGTGWHQLSTVCGGSDGRIAWAGPDEFWTIADQRPGQVTDIAVSLANISLCHFKDGRVVGSYAMPLAQPDSYLPMDAAVCRAPDDCWFGGQRRGAGGGFHLHWDGSSVRVAISPQDHAIADMTNVGGTLFESVDLSNPDPNEDLFSPPALHRIVTGATAPFQSVLPGPDFGVGADSSPVDPTTQAPLALGSDGAQAWAAAGRQPFMFPAPGESAAGPLLLRYAGGSWTQVPLAADALAAGEQPLAVAPEPGTASAWVALDASADDGAHVAHVNADGTVDARATLGPDEGVGPRGGAGPIACPAANDCWTATAQGWLFHYTDGRQRARDSDPAFAGVITFRPADSGVPVVAPDAAPPDDSLANQALTPPPVTPKPKPKKKPRRRVVKAKPLMRGVHTTVVHRTTLRMTFTLTARASVQLVALRRGKVVARTRRAILPRGRRKLELHLNPHRWPTKLDVRVKAAKKKR